MSEIDIKYATLPAAAEGSLDQILEKLYLKKSLDFRDYKVSSISRRIDRRLRATESDSYQQYCDFLDLNPDEYDQLADNLTINVTEFFRDDAPWHLLKEIVFPDLLSRKITNNDTRTPLRVWSAGCATGQETYSIAILLNELVRKMDIPIDVRVYGTDIASECLDIARKGQYNSELFTGMNPQLIETYFNTDSSICHSIRHHVRFYQHDLVLDPPLGNMDLIVCRNVAIYFSRELQNDLFTNFYYGLREGGYLFLGKAETLSGEVHKKFTPVNAKWKIFQKQ